MHQIGLMVDDQLQEVVDQASKEALESVHQLIYKKGSTAFVSIIHIA